MSNVSQFFGSGNGATGLYQFHAATISGSFTVRKRGQYIVSAIGGGGAGAGNWGGGGGAGGIAQSQLTLEVGDILSFVCGAGAPSSSSNGGNTTVTLNSVGILTANGGSSSVNTVGGTGGTASGGNSMNVTGGMGQNGTGGQGGYNQYGTAGGGGAVGVYGTVCNAITNTDTLGKSAGAGTQGSTSPKAFMNALPISIDSYSEGSYQSVYYNQFTSSAGQIDFPAQRILAPTGSQKTIAQYYGYSGTTLGFDRRGHGSGGIRDSSGNFSYSAMGGGMFAGGAGYDGSSYYVYTTTGGPGGMFGGGAGGGYAGGRGGDGGVIIEWMAYTL